MSDKTPPKIKIVQDFVTRETKEVLFNDVDITPWVTDYEAIVEVKDMPQSDHAPTQLSPQISLTLVGIPIEAFFE